jgi:hypothetical protein
MVSSQFSGYVSKRSKKQWTFLWTEGRTLGFSRLVSFGNRKWVPCGHKCQLFTEFRYERWTAETSGGLRGVLRRKYHAILRGLLLGSTRFKLCANGELVFRLEVAQGESTAISLILRRLKYTNILNSFERIGIVLEKLTPSKSGVSVTVSEVAEDLTGSFRKKTTDKLYLVWIPSEIHLEI